MVFQMIEKGKKKVSVEGNPKSKTKDDVNSVELTMSSYPLRATLYIK